MPVIAGTGTIELLTPPLRLTADDYRVSISVRRKGFDTIADAKIGARFHVQHPDLDPYIFGIFHEEGHWTFGR